MLSVLVNAYACAPNMGSEPGMAWNWVTNLAKYAKLYVITEGEWEKEIAEALETFEYKQNITFFYNPVSAEIRKMCWNQGDWRFYYYYDKWQKETLTIAHQVIEQHSIDIVHQLNMIGFREPGYLWKIPSIPFIWGPLDAKEKFPTAFLEGATAKQKVFLHIKNFITYLQLKTSNKVKAAVASAKFLVAASSDSQVTLKKYFGVDAFLINETGCYVKKDIVKSNIEKDTFDLLWVGKLDFRKQLGLAMRILAQIKLSNARLHIVGDNASPEAHAYMNLAKELGIANQCIWHGKIPHAKVQEIMLFSDLFLFTSVAEGTPHVVLEAISNQLPVICFDTCGQGDVVNNRVGMKFKPIGFQKGIQDMSQAIIFLHQNKQILQELSHNCLMRQEELSWDSKARQMIEIYQQAKR